MTSEIILESWHGFTGARTTHQIIERMGTRCLTVCGLSIPVADIRKPRGRKCGNCKRYNREFFQAMSPQTKYVHGLLKKISDLRLHVKHLRADRASPQLPFAPTEKLTTGETFAP